MPRVLIATDQPILAKGLETVLTAGGLEVTDICHDICEVFDSLQRCPPDVAILSIPVLPSTEVVRDLHRLAPKCQFVSWPRVGADDSLDRVVEAINMMANFTEPEATPAALVDSNCSPEERELVRLLGYGLSVDEIAAAMHSDRAAILRMLNDISDALGAQDRYELAMFGLSKLKEPEPVGGNV